MLKAIKIRLYPNKEQQFMINKLLGCYRFVYNQCLEYSIKMYESEKASPTLPPEARAVAANRYKR